MRIFLAIALSLPGCGSTDDKDEGVIIGNGMVHYSSRDPLTATASDVVLVGLPGAVQPLGATIEAENINTRAKTPAQAVADGSFAIQLSAAWNDQVRLTARVESNKDELELELGDSLSDLATPTLDTCPTCRGRVLEVVDADTIKIHVSALLEPSPPYVVFNQARGIARLIPDTASVTIEASTGDAVCLFQVETAHASPTYCETTP